MATSVVLNQAVKRYGDVEVIHGIDLTIDPGEFTVFVGPSGCGKSTLLRMIAGLEPISGGDLLIDGARMNEVPAAKRGIAMVFQSYALYPHMTVYQNLAFGLETARVPKAEIQQRVARAAEILRIEPLLKRKPKQLSRRAAAARRHRPGHRARTEDLPVRRAAVEPRRRAAGADARRDRQAAQRPRQHHDLRDARPGRGHDHGRQDRGAAGRASSSRSARRSTSTTTRATGSSPASSARRR